MWALKPAVTIALVKQKVVDRYRRFAFTNAARSSMHCTSLFRRRFGDAETISRTPLQKQMRLKDRSKKPLDDHLDGAILSELYAE